MTFPGDKLLLGRYYGPSIDVRPALTAGILIINGQQVHRYTYRALATYELVKPDETKARDDFDTATGEKLGPAAPAKDFESEPEIVTPALDWYEDDEEHKNYMTEVDGITPEAMDNYWGGDNDISW